MLMDRDWLQFNRATKEYIEGAWNFVKMAEKITGYSEKILCPCKDCQNLRCQSIDSVFAHLVISGMDQTDTERFHHGEESYKNEKVFSNVLPKDNVMPRCTCSDKKFLQQFDLEYEKIHACFNDCCLFRKDYESLEECPKCGASRRKVHIHG